MRQTVTKPLWEKLHVWLQLERARVLDGGATAKALNYRLNAWDTLTRYIDDGQLPIDTDVFVPCPLSKVAVDHGQFSGQPIGLVVMVQGHVHLIDLLGGHPRLGQELRGV